MTDTCTCPPTGRRLPHRNVCPRWRRRTSRTRSVQDRTNSNPAPKEATDD